MTRGRPTPGVTVVIPTYRRPDMLRRAIASVTVQRYPRTLVAVYDNAGDPATEAVTTEFAAGGAQVRYHAHGRNIGANPNFIYALDRIESEYFVILSDDDFLLPGSLERGMAALAGHPDALFVASPVLLVDPGGRVLKVEGRWPPGLYEKPRGIVEMAARGHFMWIGTTFRRRALELAGNLDPSAGAVSDMDFLFRVAARGNFLTIVEPAAVFGWHPSSTSSLPGIDQFWPAWKQVADKLRIDAALDPRVGVSVGDQLERRLAGKLALIGLFACSRGLTGEARRSAALLAGRYHRIPEAALVWTVAWLVTWLPPLKFLLARLAQAARWPGRRRMRTIQERFDGEYRTLFELRHGEPVARPRKDSAA
ncbi:MAG: glycosyltransferase family 2 protein [Chloroflexi bacterium]|nr:MAG: glycosyltransferase family 2 protein [Chloroflexota bacterium]